MADTMSPQDKLDLVKLNLYEVLKEDLIEDVVVRQNRPLKIYWGKSPFQRYPGGYAHPRSQVLRQPGDLIVDIS